ncbi:hypothetical protein ACF0H5_015398 [Mactra antiquata]
MNDTVILPHPGVCEHVTKMSKVIGKQSGPTKVPAPQFRRLPIVRDSRFIDETPNQSPRESPPPSEEELQQNLSDRPPTQTFIQHDSPRRIESRESFVEMKLGRNMRAVPKGRLVSKYAPSSINSQ